MAENGVDTGFSLQNSFNFAVGLEMFIIKC